MKLRALILILLLAIASVANAQDACFGLSEEDCAAINSAYEAELNSFMMDFSIDFTVTGIPDGDILFSVTGSGPFEMDAAAMMAMAEMGSMMVEDIPVDMALTMDVSFDVPDMGAQSATIGFVMVDNVLYLQDPESGMWAGLDLLEAANDPSLTGGLPVDPAMFSDPAALGEMAGMGDMAPFEALLEVPGFISYTRDGDVFNFVADFTSLLTAPEFMSALEAIGEATGDPSIASLGMLAPMILQEGVISVQQTVTDGVVTGLEFNTTALINGAMIDSSLEAPVALDLSFVVNVTDLNQDFDIQPPAEFEMIPLSGM